MRKHMRKKHVKFMVVAPMRISTRMIIVLAIGIAVVIHKCMNDHAIKCFLSEFIRFFRRANLMIKHVGIAYDFIPCVSTLCDFTPHCQWDTLLEKCLAVSISRD